MEEILKYFPKLTAEQRAQFGALGALYEEWNARINVISRKEMASGEFYVRHVLHSLAIVRACSFSAGARVLDIGTGGGFPAIPLAIMFPEAHFTAVDSIGKKIRVVQEIASAIGLHNLGGVNGRVENVAGRFDYAVSRAVAPARELIGWVNGKIEHGREGSLPNGMLLLKGGDLSAELAETGREYLSFDISEWFDEEFFETKKVLFLPEK